MFSHKNVYCESILMKISNVMYRIERKQQLPVSLDESWKFFSFPSNLKKIMPPDLGFNIVSGGEGAMYKGMVITYDIDSIFRVPFTWVTEITEVEEKKLFVDRQRSGPYAYWNHQHHFKAIPNGVEIIDILEYKMPLGVLGSLVHPFLVKGKIEKIFAYRIEKLEELFGVYESSKVELKKL
jgi:ligand-binding SRPBCC domain-containing protein